MSKFQSVVAAIRVVLAKFLFSAFTGFPVIIGFRIENIFFQLSDQRCLISRHGTFCYGNDAKFLAVLNSVRDGIGNSLKLIGYFR